MFFVFFCICSALNQQVNNDNGDQCSVHTHRPCHMDFQRRLHKPLFWGEPKKCLFWGAPKKFLQLTLNFSLGSTGFFGPCLNFHLCSSPPTTSHTGCTGDLSLSLVLSAHQTLSLFIQLHPSHQAHTRVSVPCQKFTRPIIMFIICHIYVMIFQGFTTCLSSTSTSISYTTHTSRWGERRGNHTITTIIIIIITIVIIIIIIVIIVIIIIPISLFQPTAFSVTAIHPVEFLNIQAVYIAPMFLMDIHAGDYDGGDDADDEDVNLFSFLQVCTFFTSCTSTTTASSTTVESTSM